VTRVMDVARREFDIAVPFEGAVEYIGTLPRYDLIYEDGTVEGRLYGNPCRPSAEAVRMAAALE
jgi:hypothetical protein